MRLVKCSTDMRPKPRVRWFLPSLILLSCISCGQFNQNAPRKLSSNARLEVYETSLTNVPNTLAATDPVKGIKIYLLLPPIITAADVDTVQRSDDAAGISSLTVQMTPAGSTKLSAATSSAQPKQIAIVVNGAVINVVTPRSTISQGFMLTGGALQKDREKIFDALTK